MQFTVVVPIANVDPDAGTQLTVGLASQASVAVVEKLTAAPEALVASAVTLAAHVMFGAVVSVTVTVNEQDRVFAGVA